ncbi:MAG: glycosyltransferase family 2 protein [Methanotrichaceae archaeon]
MEFSVIVLTLNNVDYIEECLSSISRQTFPRERCEIIVSYGKSVDRTTEIVSRYADKVVVSEKRGIWQGRNFGAQFATGRYLAFIDADTRIKEDYLEIVHRYLKNRAIELTTAFEIDGTGIKTKAYGYLCCGYLWLYSKIYNATLDDISKENQIFCDALDRTENDLKARGTKAGYLLERISNLSESYEQEKKIIEKLKRSHLEMTQAKPK